MASAMMCCTAFTGSAAQRVVVDIAAARDGARCLCAMEQAIAWLCVMRALCPSLVSHALEYNIVWANAVLTALVQADADTLASRSSANWCRAKPRCSN
jgi:hypothetical protein